VLRIGFLSCLLLIWTTFGQQTVAQSVQTWPFEQRCFAEPAIPAEDWIFEGTLLLTSSRRLHAYQQGWETPRVLLFFPPELFERGLLSPDGRWFAAIVGDTRVDGVVTIMETEAIRVYSTATDETYEVEWKNTYSAVHRVSGHGLYWLDNEHLLYSLGDGPDESWFIIDPFSGSVTEWRAEFTPSWFDFILAPDALKAIYTEYNYPYWLVHNGEDEIEVNIWNNAIWQPDSQYFAAFTRRIESYGADTLTLFDLNGNVTDVVFNIPEGVSPALPSNGWSKNARYFLFTVQNLYLADTQAKQVIDTCIPATFYLTAEWSADGSQIAIVEPYNDKREIQILDLDLWERYVVGYHSGEIIGWRAEG
jgi:hypothetical protein